MTWNGCPLCGTTNHSCGQPFTGTPVDLPRMEARAMGGVQKYKVTVNGTETVLKLNEQDAKRYENAELVDDAAAPQDAESTEARGDEPTAKAARPADKSRAPRNK